MNAKSHSPNWADRIVAALRHRADTGANPHVVALARADFYQFMFWISNAMWIVFFSAITASIVGAR